MRRRLLYYVIKYAGNYDRVTRALKNNEKYHTIKCRDNYISIYDDIYPKSLLALKKPPYILFYKGDINLINQKASAVVGSRKACNYGIVYTEKLSAKLAKQEVVVSGMAKGIDTYAHLAAIKHGHSIAVLGSGINYVYPKSNQQLYLQLCKNHLVISEYPNMTIPKPYYFPFRNRIIAALANKVYVTQASMRSGTMLTVNEALELNKDVYVLPYRVNDYFGGGCNYLIQQGANLIMAEDLDH